ncbi:hypothetical protein BSPWISOXPB_1647 [uncultured Gammaproteobacteria bacterium]|nr:hypothetical protein BSPWISOXPB_1647 [uncultured Gammaproteobacteria bacterium]
MDVWDIPNEEIIQYMRDIFPKNVSDENDDKVCDFGLVKIALK